MTCDWIEISKGLLTPAIGFLAIYIAWQQWTTNRNKLRLDLFDRRFAVFQATRQFLSCVFRDGKANYQDLEEFRIGIIDTPFLFDDALNEYLQNLYKKALEARKYHNKLDEVPIGDERNDLVGKKMASVKELTDELETLQAKFSPFLKLNH